jgi:predicted ATPase
MAAGSARHQLRMRLENFRLFRDSGWFTLAPLTCVVGRNSSGKSSIVSSLLLLRQSVEEQALGSAPMALTLSGPYCDLGNYSDVVYDHDESAEISFSFEASVTALASDQRARRGQLVEFSVPRPLPVMRSYFGRWLDTKLLPRKGAVAVRLSFAADERFGPSLSRLEITVSRLGTASFVRTTGLERSQHWRVYTTDLPRQSLALRPRARSFFPTIEIRSASYSHSAPRTKRRIRTFVAACQAMLRHVSDALTLSNQVGPFRTPPERRYAGGVSASRSGPSGEQAVGLLITEALLRASGQRPLHRAVSFWVKHLGLARTLDVKDLAKRLNLFEVGIRGARQGTKSNLADVGFGISQVLPVLVQGLITQRGGIYVVQQPEIHLHPDAQAALADFFIYLASEGVMVVVETHSEYLLLRIRLRLAEGGRPIKFRRLFTAEAARPLAVDDVSILLTGSDQKESTVKELEINDSFQFANLPPGFMSQALEDRAALLKTLGRRNA